MTTSTPPAWAWLEEKYLPVPYPGAFAAMAEDQYESLALSIDPRPLPDADTLGERNDSESPIESRKLPDSATLRERNGSPDPTGTDVWPLERDQCPADSEPALITLVSGGVAIVDPADCGLVLGFRWSEAQRGHTTYAKTTGSHTGQYMHRMIMDASPGQEVDHVNGNGLDNRRANLRLVSRSQNNANQRKTRGSSKYKGVHWFAETTRWRAVIGHGGKHWHIGYFTDEVDAAIAYDLSAIDRWGEYARPNFLRSA